MSVHSFFVIVSAESSNRVTPGKASRIAFQSGTLPMRFGLNTYVPTVEQLKKVVTQETKCILLPNLIGNVPDWKAIREAFPGVTLFEDSADTITKTECTDIATTSFYASHVITAGGIGGMVMFNEEEHLKRAIMFRDWGRI